VVPDNTPVEPVVVATSIRDPVAAAGDVEIATNSTNPAADRAAGKRPAAAEPESDSRRVRQKTTVSRPLHLEPEPEAQDDAPEPRAAAPQGGFFFVRSTR